LRTEIENETAAVIPCRIESWDHILPTLESLQKQTAPLQQIILVDDASPTPLTLPVSDPKLTVVRNDRNLGISGSRNHGAESANTQFVLFINCGMIIPPTWHEVVRAHMQTHPKAALASTRVVSHKPDELMTRWRFRFLENPYTRTPGTRKVPWLMGHVTLTRRRILLELGGFDQNLRVSQEDGEICRRLERTATRYGRARSPDVRSARGSQGIRTRSWCPA
jgi:GT2 family glycosyltransferase